MKERYKDSSPWFELSFQCQCLAVEASTYGDEWANRKTGRHAVVNSVDRKRGYVYLTRPDGGRDTRIQLHYFASDYWPSPATYERICTIRVPRFAHLQ